MTLPVQPNTTCDIQRTGSSGSTVDVAAVPCILQPFLTDRPLTDVMATHILQVDQGVDIRDPFPTAQDGTGGDKVFIPDISGVKYLVALVRRQGRSTTSDSLIVYLRRTAVTWPNQNL